MISVTSTKMKHSVSEHVFVGSYFRYLDLEEDQIAALKRTREKRALSVTNLFFHFFGGTLDRRPGIYPQRLRQKK